VDAEGENPLVVMDDEDEDNIVEDEDSSPSDEEETTDTYDDAAAFQDTCRRAKRNDPYLTVVQVECGRIEELELLTRACWSSECS